jgi:hypothetical protein
MTEDRTAHGEVKPKSPIEEEEPMVHNLKPEYTRQRVRQLPWK